MNNNPVRNTDPTGHDVDCGLGEPDCQTGLHRRKSQPIPFHTSIPTSTSTPTFTPTAEPIEVCVVTTQTPETTTDPDFEGDVFDFTYSSVELYNYLRTIAYYGLRGVDALAPNSILDGAVSRGTQLWRDRDDNFSFTERISRALIVGVEGVITDSAATTVGVYVGYYGMIAGAIVAPEAGGSAIGASGGYVVGSTGAYVVGNLIWNDLNENYFFPFIHSWFDD